MPLFDEKIVQQIVDLEFTTVFFLFLLLHPQKKLFERGNQLQVGSIPNQRDQIGKTILISDELETFLTLMTNQFLYYRGCNISFMVPISKCFLSCRQQTVRRERKEHRASSTSFMATSLHSKTSHYQDSNVFQVLCDKNFTDQST